MKNTRIETRNSRTRRDVLIEGELVFSVRFNRPVGWMVFDAEGQPLRWGTVGKLIRWAERQAALLSRGVVR